MIFPFHDRYQSQLMGFCNRYIKDREQVPTWSKNVFIGYFVQGSALKVVSSNMDVFIRCGTLSVV